MTEAVGPGHNSGAVSAEDAAEAMKRALAPWEARCVEFETKAGKAVVDSADAAGAGIDFVRMVRALHDKASDLRTEVQGPYRDAALAAGSVAARFLDRLEAAERQMQTALKAYNDDRKAKAAAQAAAQQVEEERLARIAAERDGVPPPPPPSAPPPVQRRRRAAPIRSDLGGVMTEHAKLTVTVTDVTLIPAHILNTPRVLEAIRKVAYDLVKNGIDVPGVTKGEADVTTIR